MIDEELEPDKMSSEEIIEGVALAVINNITNHIVIFRLPKPNRHHHLFPIRTKHFSLRLISDDMKNYYDSNTEIQGFYTNKQMFVGRITAKEIAVRSGQYKPATDSRMKELYSEDLW